MGRKGIYVSDEVKAVLDRIKHYGQTYDGFIRELLEKNGYTIKGNNKKEPKA